jgi:hypothetical protein
MVEEIKGELKEVSSEKEIEQGKNSLKKKFSSLIKDNYDKIFIVLLVAAFIIRILIFIKTMNQPLWWDEADYLATAKRWGLGLKIDDIWYYRRGFLWPAVGAAFFFLGIGEIGMRFLVVFLSTGIVALSYFAISKIFDKKSALLVAIGITLSWISLFFTGRVLTDIPATFFLLLALLFFWKGYVLKEGNKFLYLFGIFYACSLLVRFQFAMFALPFLVFIFTREKFKFLKNKHIWITVGLAFAVLLPFFILYWMHYGNVFTDILSHYFGVSGVSATAPIQRTTSTLFAYFKDLPYILTGSYNLTAPIFVIFIIGIFIFFQDMVLGIDKIFKNEEIQKKFFIFLWIIVPFLVLGYITDYVEQRYILSTLPFLFLIAVSPFVKLGDIINKYSSKISKKKAYIFSIILLLFFLIVSLGAVPSNYAWSNSLIDNKMASYLEIEQAGLWIKANSNPGDLILTQSRPQIVYYAERSVEKGEVDFSANESYFNEVVQELKPKYMVLSSYEQSQPWIYSYPQNNTQLLIPVQAYPSDKPAVIVYEFNYS